MNSRLHQSQIASLQSHAFDEFLKKPAEFKPAPPAEAPPGMPIGEDGIQ